MVVGCGSWIVEMMVVDSVLSVKNSLIYIYIYIYIFFFHFLVLR